MPDQHHSSAPSSKQLLEACKDQGVSVERGFHFLKDPLFYAESLYLKSEKGLWYDTPSSSMPSRTIELSV
jgi:transposase